MEMVIYDKPLPRMLEELQGEIL